MIRALFGVEFLLGWLVAGHWSHIGWGLEGALESMEKSPAVICSALILGTFMYVIYESPAF
jgi:hypothetical protein